MEATAPDGQVITIESTIPPTPEFTQLVNFGRKVADVCKTTGVEPVAYGSLAYLAYTQDENYVADDIDFLVSETHFDNIAHALTAAGIEYARSQEWHSILILQDGLKVELDATEFWQKDLPSDFANFSINGTTLKIVGLDSLMEIYRNSAEFSQDVPEDKPEKYRAKFEALQRIKQARQELQS